MDDERPAYGTPVTDEYLIKPGGGTMIRTAPWAIGGLVLSGFMLSGGLGLFALFGLLGVVPLAIQIFDLQRGKVYFAVGASGVYLGESHHEYAPEAPDAPIPWDSIAEVLVLDVLIESRDGDGDTRRNWHHAVGVRRTSDPPGRVSHYQLFDKYRLDRPEIEDAVRRFGGGVRVVDGPTLAPPDLGDVISGLLDAWRNRDR